MRVHYNTKDRGIGRRIEQLDEGTARVLQAIEDQRLELLRRYGLRKAVTLPRLKFMEDEHARQA